MTLDTISHIKTICKDAYQPLFNVVNSELRKPYIFDINLADLEDYNYNDIRKSNAHRELFDSLMQIKGPVLYWFEIIDKTVDSNRVLEAFNIYKQSADCKAIPAVKNSPDHGTGILYVGKVKTQFWGRLITHLGFFKTKATQGLQLFYWAKPLGLQLRVHVYEFDNEMKDLMGIVENGMAAELKPLLGKHR